MPQQSWSPKRERQYEHMKEGLEERGRSEDQAESIAARTVNKERARRGESTTASLSSTDDISSGRRGGLRSHRGAGGPTYDRAPIVFRFPGHGDMTRTGTVLEVDEPRLLVYTWGEETLRFELHASPGGGTRLVLTDAVDPQPAARNAAGWETCLERMAGRARDDTGWRVRFERYCVTFEPALGPQLGPPPGFEATPSQL